MGRVSVNYGRRATASETTGTVLSILGLAIYSVILYVLAVLPGISFVSCDENRELCKAQGIESVLYGAGWCAVAIAIVVAVVLVASRRRSAWKVVAVVAGLVTACFVAATILEINTNR